MWVLERVPMNRITSPEWQREQNCAALERLAVEKGLTDREAMRVRKEAWTKAYRHTPHGKAVEMK
jgi:hypothetical protein